MKELEASATDGLVVELLGPPEAKPLIFVHGILGAGANWRSVARSFETEYRIALFDQRGHGRSSHAPGAGQPNAFSLEGLAEDLSMVIEKSFSRRPTHIVGHSLGGRVALRCAARHPEIARSLVIEDIGPVFRTEGQALVELVLSQVPVPFSSRKSAQDWFDRHLPDLVADPAHAQTVGRFLLSNLISVEADRAELHWRFSVDGMHRLTADLKQQNQWSELESLSVPTLIVRGENSDVLSPSIYNEMQRRCPVARGVEIARAGHWVHSDQRESFVRVLQEFLGSVDSAKSPSPFTQ